MRRPVALLALLAWAAPAGPARASMVLQLELPELVFRAERVVVVEVVAVNAAWDDRHERIESDAEVRVLESWKGDAVGGQALHVGWDGGKAGGIEMRVIGAPALRGGERALLFLRGAPDRAQVVGMAQGCRILRWDRKAARWVAQGGAGGAAVLAPGPDGRLVPARPDPERPLDDLRASVRALVRG